MYSLSFLSRIAFLINSLLRGWVNYFRIGKMKKHVL
ncbi:hypothetical protein HCJ57_15875 [Listeria booriae]|nr:hypothetical protein [Listeria booriae]MBC2069375.1 hypothetical protein [Listeria booriae]